MLSNSVCNHTYQTPASLSSDFFHPLYDYRPIWTPLRPITIINISYMYVYVDICRGSCDQYSAAG